ncbi:hypothetical protein BDN72DRAFT_798898 [Pluteus cervinus]|uniref:Uncharacterized protein n=1 Tax=Pluteus cervinus TaxID=181527 RepID=A0ACD3AQB7_9AGAR|nr:hypothetical protein BDN72DRAFT_798898 [Pluteus cervinus]
MSQRPPLPQIGGDSDIILDIYTHRSLRAEDDMSSEEYGNTDRLGALGENVLKTAITTHYFYARPMPSGPSISDLADDFLGDTNILEISQHYNVARRLRAASDVPIANNPEELRRFWYVFVGALYVRNGMNAVQHFVSNLIDPESGTNTIPTGPPPQPPQPPQPPPPDEQMNFLPGLPRYDPSHPHGPEMSLSLFHETAVKYGHVVTFSAEHEGPAHALTWTVTCQLDGLERGKGVGTNQRIAKSQAARETWMAMGWGPLV